MELPKRDANSNDPITYPYSDQPRSASNSFDVSAWLRWRMTDPELADDLRAIMEVEVIEAEALGNMLDALDKAKGDTLEDKMRVPEQKDTLKACHCAGYAHRQRSSR